MQGFAHLMLELLAAYGWSSQGRVGSGRGVGQVNSHGAPSQVSLEDLYTGISHCGYHVYSIYGYGYLFKMV